jgi:hypothetical protein
METNKSYWLSAVKVFKVACAHFYSLVSHKAFGRELKSAAHLASARDAEIAQNMLRCRKSAKRMAAGFAFYTWRSVK